MAIDRKTNAPQLRRSLGLPLLVFYGVGVTIGAGIFALIGEVLAVAGDHAAWSFVLAGIVAGFTGFSYVLLSQAYPKAAGEAVFVKNGMGNWPGRLTGYAVVVVAILSSAVIALAFARYVSSFSGVGETACLVGVILFLTAIAVVGVRQSVLFAAAITVLEVGTLLVIIAVNAPVLADSQVLLRVLAPPTNLPAFSSAIAGAFLAFFAFIGFEDIENMAEETHAAERNIPLAIIFTLVISVAIYAVVAVVAAAFPDRSFLIVSKAPLAALFERATGHSGTTIAMMASIAMINGILVQIVMASRVLYGMSREGLVSPWIGKIHTTRQTPVRATVLIAGSVLLLSLLLPLVQLAELTSLVMLLVFAAVNASLYLIGQSAGSPQRLKRWRWWGVIGCAISLALVVAQTASW